MKPIFWPLLVQGAMVGTRGLGPYGLPRRPAPRKETKCTLPGCDEMTAHNGGYCCAAHCNEHRAIQGVSVI